MIKEFKEFAFRGNMIDLAVGIIIGIAFGQVVDSLAKDVLMNAVAAVFGKADYSDLALPIWKGTILYGKFLTACVSFLMVAVSLFFVVRAINRIMGPKDAPPEPPARRECPFCCTAIPVVATRCSACTSDVQPAGT
jgi:large conductance mechanosensitive channel